MSRIDRTYERIRQYLKGLLSNRERHDLEKEMMQDMFDDEAFEGLSQLNGSALDSDMASLMNRMDARTGHQKRSLVWFYRIAAGIILMIGLGTVLYLLMKPPAPGLITQELKKEERPAPPETAVPTPPVMHEKEGVLKEEQGEPEENIPSKKEEIADVTVLPLEDIAEIESVDAVRAPEARTYQEALQEETYRNQDTVVMTQYITGRVLGVNRQALEGVSVMEKGSDRATLTDMNGNFRLRVKNPGSRLALNYIGYKTKEVPTREVAGKEITLDEDMVAMSEVVVVGYGSRKRSGVEKAAGEVRDTLTNAYEVSYTYNKPVTPGGTLKEFESWVETHIETQKFVDLLPGKYRIRVNLHVNTDGTITGINIRKDVPEIVAEEYKRAVSQSPAWQPALANKVPVEAEVEIIFSLTVE
jgi:hypothetical protein